MALTQDRYLVFYTKQANQNRSLEKEGKQTGGETRHEENNDKLSNHTKAGLVRAQQTAA
jgi:hypothetical protein